MNDLGRGGAPTKLLRNFLLSWPSVLSPHAGLLLSSSDESFAALALPPLRPPNLPSATAQDFSFSDALELNGLFRLLQGRGL